MMFPNKLLSKQALCTSMIRAVAIIIESLCAEETPNTPVVLFKEYFTIKIETIIPGHTISARATKKAECELLRNGEKR
jgi:hypothetical protein